MCAVLTCCVSGNLLLNSRQLIGFVEEEAREMAQ